MSKRDKHGPHDRATKFPLAVYERELQRLQTELVQLKEWVRVQGQNFVVVIAVSALLLERARVDALDGTVLARAK